MAKRNDTKSKKKIGKMNKRDTKFVSRIVVLFMITLCLSVSVRVALENNQLTNLLPRTITRDFLLIFAPLASLMAIQYTLAVKSFGMRSLTTEGMIYLFCVSIFLALSVAYFFGQSVEVPAEDCPQWKLFGCGATVRHQSNYLLSVPIGISGFGALFLALKREKILN